MAYKRTKSSGGGLKDDFRNDVVTTNELQLHLKQLAKDVEFYELEPFEVMDIYRPNAENGISIPGVVKGRNVISEQGDRPDEMSFYYPLNPNILQYPVVGDILVGMSYKSKRYYLASLQENLSNVNPKYRKQFNQSGVNDFESISSKQQSIGVLNSDRNPSDYQSGEYFKDTLSERLVGAEGDTIIQGRFGQSIHLGSSQINGQEESPNVKVVAGLEVDEESLALDKASMYMTTNEEVQYSEPTFTLGRQVGLNTDYTEPQIIFDSDRIIINAKRDDIGIFSGGDVHIKGTSVNIHNNEAVNIVTKELVADTSAGVKKDITKKLNDIDGDTQLLPENILPMARAMRPTIENINNGVISAASKILPPVIAPGTPNPLNISGHLIDLRFFRDQLKKVKDFFEFNWVNKQEWKTVSLNELTEELGLNDLKTLPPEQMLAWDEFFDDVDAAKAKVENIQAQAAAAAVAVAALNAAFDVIQNGGGSTQTIIEALDAYEADPNNPPVDTTDIRDVIADGADTEDVKRYLDFGGSPQVRELLTFSQQKEQDAQKLSSMGIIADLINEGMNL